MFESLVDYNEENVETAIEQLMSFKVNLGGTQISDHLNQIFTNPSNSGLPKNVYLITDGCVYNHKEVTNLIENKNVDFTVHTFGIGSGVSTELIMEAAAAGQGEYYFFNNKAEGLKANVVDSLYAAMELLFFIKSIELMMNGKPVRDVAAFDKTPTVIRHGSHFNYYAIVKGFEVELEGEITITLDNSETNETKVLTVDFEECAIRCKDQRVSNLCANELISFY
jgi:hypothetical protein